MTRIIADISVSLDGFVTEPDPSPDNGLGTGGEALHVWAFSDDPDDRRVLAASSDSGKDLDVILMGGGATIGSALDAGLVDALTLHLAPIGLSARDTTVHRRSAAHAGAAERDLDIDRDAPDLRRLLVIR
jgi:riboflavin biosynthesis pyrimidine reductase